MPILSEPLIAYRIHNRRFPQVNGMGAAIIGGRWNSPGVFVVYACATFEGAILERVVHFDNSGIPQDEYQLITIPAGINVEECSIGHHKIWDQNEFRTVDYGDNWIKSAKSVALLVPGFPARPYQTNILINPNHPDFSQLKVSASASMAWDQRLTKR
jgi:RES domain-containing protein